MGNIYGYARVSTPKQSIERQIRNIKAVHPDAIIFQDTYTGTKMTRSDWLRLMKIVKPGDLIVFDSVSRMSRDADEGFVVYEKLYNSDVELEFLKEPQINTQTYKKALANCVPLTGTAVDYILEGVNRYLMELAKEQIRMAFEQAEKEVVDLRQRTREGLITAKLNGKTLGQEKGARLVTKKSLSAKEIIRKHSKDFGGSLSDAECQRLAGVSRNSYYKYKANIREELCTCEE